MIKKPPRSPRFYTPEQWKEFADKWQNSSLSQKDFCQQHELTHSAFLRWRKKITRLESGLVHKKKYRKPCYHTATQWKEFIDDWKQSALSQSNYCRQKNLTESAFIAWRKKLENPELAKLANLQERTRYNFDQSKGLIEEWKKSGLSTANYCAKNGLNPGSFINGGRSLSLQNFPPKHQNIFKNKSHLCLLLLKNTLYPWCLNHLL